MPFFDICVGGCECVDATACSCVICVAVRCRLGSLSISFYIALLLYLSCSSSIYAAAVSIDYLIDCLLVPLSFTVSVTIGDVPWLVVG